jgi:hypothetical protein
MQQTRAMTVSSRDRPVACRRETDLNAMTKVLSTLGFFGCVLMLVIYLNAPSASSVEAREDGVSCHTVEVAIDEGYGVSQTETRKVCDGL